MLPIVPDFVVYGEIKHAFKFLLSFRITKWRIVVTNCSNSPPFEDRNSDCWRI